MWQPSEAYANNRLGSTTPATAAAHDARPRNGLLAGARRFRRRPCPPRFLALGLAAGLLAPRPRVLLVFILARGGRRRLRLLIGDAGLALQRFAALAFDRADAGGMLGKFRDQLRRHADIAGRLTADRHIPPKRCAGRRVQRAVDLAAEASEPDQFGLRRANQLGRIGHARRTLGGFSHERIQRRDHRPAEPIASEGLGEGFQILDARSLTAFGRDLLEPGLLVLARGLLRGGEFGLLARLFGFPRLLFARGPGRGGLQLGLALFLVRLALGLCRLGLLFGLRRLGLPLARRALRRGFRGGAIPFGLFGPLFGFGSLAFGFRGPRLLLGFRRLGAALVVFPLLRCRLFGPALFRLALRFLRGLARRLPLGARLLPRAPRRPSAKRPFAAAR